MIDQYLNSKPLYVPNQSCSEEEEEIIALHIFSHLIEKTSNTRLIGESIHRPWAPRLVMSHTQSMALLYFNEHDLKTNVFNV